MNVPKLGEKDFEIVLFYRHQDVLGEIGIRIPRLYTMVRFRKSQLMTFFNENRFQPTIRTGHMTVNLDWLKEEKEEDKDENIFRR